MDISIAAENAPFLNTLDYIIIAIVLLSGILALIRGFVREFLSLCAWVGAFFIAITFYEPAVPMVSSYISNEKFAMWVAILAVFFVALILLSILGYVLSGFVKGKTFVWLDRSAGFLYGLLRGVIVLCLIYLGVVLILWSDINKYEPYENISEQDKKNANVPPELLINARSRILLHYGADLLVSPEFVPQDIREDWERVNSDKVDITTTAKEQAETVQEQITEAVEELPKVVDEVVEQVEQIEVQ